MNKIILFYGKMISWMTWIILIAAGIFMIPQLWGWKPLIVMSGSMEPMISTGSVLFTDTKEKDAEIDGIITYDLGGDVGDTQKLVTHRVIRIEDGQYITKGDANGQEDFVPVRSEQIIGTYLFHIPKAGWIISKLNRKLLITAAVWLLLLNIFSIMLNSMVSEE